MEWFKDDPFVKDSGEFGTKIINGKRVDYPVLDLEVPELEVLGVQPDGRPIFRRPTDKKGIAYARLMNDAYIAGGESTEGLKPYWRDTKGVDWEIEGKGEKYKNPSNPKGYRFGNAEKHKERAQFRRLKKANKVISLDERIDLMKLEFPGAPDEEVVKLAEQIHDYSESQIRATAKKARELGWDLEDRTPVSGEKYGHRSWHNLKEDKRAFNLKKSNIFPGEEYARSHNIGATKAEQVAFDRSSPLTPQGTQITPEIDQADIRKAMRDIGRPIGEDRMYLHMNEPGGLMDQALKQEQLLLDTRTPDGALRYPDLKAASEASGGLKNALRKAGTVLPFVGAGLDAWDVQQRWDEAMNNPNEGFAHFLDQAQLGIASATLGTSFWAEPANFALGVTNLGIDAARTVFEEDKRKNFLKNMRAIGRGTTYMAQQLL